MSAAQPESAVREAGSRREAGPIRWLRDVARAPWPWLFALSGVGLLLSTGMEQATLPARCGTDWRRLLSASGRADTLALFSALNPPAVLLNGWVLMLLAMMPPLLAAPLKHVYRSSQTGRRGPALLGFALGYAALWMVAGPALIGLALLMRLPGDGFALSVGFILAVAWSASPWHRLALDRGHRMPCTGSSSWAILRNGVQFGLVHGGWCFVACWAWML